MTHTITCRNKDHRPHWVVVHRRCNYSAFNGYHYTPSDYSLVKCTVPDCRRAWRTKAAYVATLPDSNAPVPLILLDAPYQEIELKVLDLLYRETHEPVICDG